MREPLSTQLGSFAIAKFSSRSGQLPYLARCNVLVLTYKLCLLGIFMPDTIEETAVKEQIDKTIARLIDGESRTDKLGLPADATEDAQNAARKKDYQTLKQAYLALKKKTGSDDATLAKSKDETIKSEYARILAASAKLGEILIALKTDPTNAQTEGKKSSTAKTKSPSGEKAGKMFDKIGDLFNEEENENDDPMLADFKKWQAFVFEMQKQFYAKPTEKVFNAIGKAPGGLVNLVKGMLNKKADKNPAQNPANTDPTWKNATVSKPAAPIPGQPQQWQTPRQQNPNVVIGQKGQQQAQINKQKNPGVQIGQARTATAAQSGIQIGQARTQAAAAAQQTPVQNTMPPWVSALPSSQTTDTLKTIDWSQGDKASEKEQVMEESKQEAKQEAQVEKQAEKDVFVIEQGNEKKAAEQEVEAVEVNERDIPGQQL